MFFLADRRRRSDRFLVWKIRIFSVAAVLTLAGIYLDERWMTGTALGLLIGGMLLRFLPGGEEDTMDGDDEEPAENGALRHAPDERREGGARDERVD